MGRLNKEGIKESSHVAFIMKGLVELLRAFYPNIKNPHHRNIHVTIFHIFMELSFHILKMLPTWDLYV